MVVLLLSFVLSLFFLQTILPILKNKLLDIPCDRSSHLSPKPRGGGICFVLITFIGSLVFYQTSNSFTFFYIFLLFPLVLVSFYDDFSSLSPYLRAITHFISSCLILFNSSFYSGFLSSFSSLLLLLLFLVISIFGVAIINFFNFMDGSDGLLASCSSVLLLASFFLLGQPPILLVLIGSLLGFLRFNWSPSSVFMGDVGSTFLGAIFFGILLNSDSITSSILITLLAAPLLIDPLFTLLRRAFLRQPIVLPHRLHLYQRLVVAGWSHQNVALAYCMPILILSLSWYFLSFSGITFALLLYICFLVCLNNYSAAPFDNSP